VTQPFGADALSGDTLQRIDFGSFAGNGSDVRLVVDGARQRQRQRRERRRHSWHGRYRLGRHGPPSFRHDHARLELSRRRVDDQAGNACCGCRINSD
jgi:hypothetical protein